MVNRLCVLLCLVLGWPGRVDAQAPATRLPTAPSDAGQYYSVHTLAIPDPIKLEVGGLVALSDDEIAVVNRRGELWRIRGIARPSAEPRFHLFASGMHEPLGLAWWSNAFYVVQRSELTRIRDTDDDGLADEYRTIAKGWGVSGNYHEYAYGPKFDRDGHAWITLNSTLGRRVIDDAAWRGWSLKVAPDGSWSAVSGGMRSPAGLGINAAGDAFFTEQQGNWVPTCYLGHMRRGAFHGYPDALEFCALPGATFSDPGPLPQNLAIPLAARAIPSFQLPAVWFPYRKMGASSTDVVLDDTGGRFGPFTNQLFVGEFTLSAINRVFLERVGGEYQGACFPFRQGFQCGVIRLGFGFDGSLWAGQSNRGWNSVGTRSYGIQRVVWNGEVPFEIAAMMALPDGFRLCFTLPVDRVAAARVRAYTMTSYTYLYHATYGSPEIDTQTLPIRSVRIAAGARELDLEIEGLRAGYVHELRISGIQSASGLPLLHPEAYYTLNRIPPAPASGSRVRALPDGNDAENHPSALGPGAQPAP